MESKRTLLLVVLGGALAAAGCGSDDGDQGDPIPANTASVLQDQLDLVQRRIDGDNVGACEDVLGGPRSPNVPAVQQALASLPEGVAADVRSALDDGFSHLFDLVGERCDELRAEQEQQDTETESVEPIPETPTETEETTPTETEETTPIEPEPPATTEEPPIEEPPTDDLDGGAVAPEGQE